MAYNYGKKQTFGQKLKGGLRRAFTIAAFGGVVIGAPAYYNYGTVHEQEVKIKDVKNDYVRWDEKRNESIYEYKIVTDKGLVLENENTKLHLKFNSADIQDNVEAGKIYRVKYYGARIDVPFIHTFPNILSATEVTPEEIAERNKAAAAAKAAAAKAAQQQAGQQQQAAQPQPSGATTTPTAPTGALSGTTPESSIESATLVARAISMSVRVATTRTQFLSEPVPRYSRMRGDSPAKSFTRTACASSSSAGLLPRARAWTMRTSEA